MLSEMTYQAGECDTMPGQLNLVSGNHLEEWNQRFTSPVIQKYTMVSEFEYTHTKKKHTYTRTHKL